MLSDENIQYLEGTNKFLENYHSLHILSDFSDPSLSSKLNMFNMLILAKYAVIFGLLAWIVGYLGWSSGGASENHNAVLAIAHTHGEHTRGKAMLRF